MIVALVGRYPANQLIMRMLIVKPLVSPYGHAPIRPHTVLVRISPGYPPLDGRLHTCYAPVRRSPAAFIAKRPAAPRLACVRPVASVHPEPGSNSSLYYLVFFQRSGYYRIIWNLTVCCSTFPYTTFCCSFVQRSLRTAHPPSIGRNGDSLSRNGPTGFPSETDCKGNAFSGTAKTFSGFFLFSFAPEDPPAYLSKAGAKVTLFPKQPKSGRIFFRFFQHRFRIRPPDGGLPFRKRVQK